MNWLPTRWANWLKRWACQPAPGQELSVPQEQKMKGGAQQNQQIVVLCSPLVAEWIGETFALLMADQHLPASILWAGHSYRDEQGIVIIRWVGEIPADFLQQLEVDEEIDDYAWYQVPELERTGARPEWRVTLSSLPEVGASAASPPGEQADKLPGTTQG